MSDISQDPDWLSCGTNLYEYVKDTNIWVDVFGLAKIIVAVTKNAGIVNNQGHAKISIEGYFYDLVDDPKQSKAIIRKTPAEIHINKVGINYNYVDIEVSDDQTKKAIAFMENRKQFLDQNEIKYNFFTNNCATFGVQALRSAGLNVPQHVISPKQLENRAKKIAKKCN